jgi:hypothetical protein
MGKIGIYDDNIHSGLTPAIIYAKEELELKIIDYPKLPEEDVPPRFIINPCASNDKSYWQGIRCFAEKNQKTKILMVTPDSQGLEHAKTILKGLENVVYAVRPPEGTEVIFNFIQESR